MINSEKQANMQNALVEVCSWVNNLKPALVSNKAALFNIDTNNGFVSMGTMANPLANKIIDIKENGAVVRETTYNEYLNLD